MQKRIVLFLFLILYLSSSYAQQQPWPFYASIEEYKKQDIISPPKKGAVLFVGSSSIRRWDDLKARFKDVSIIQRGFGGSEFRDILHYADDIIIPYKPSKVVLYAGENDFAKGRSVDEVFLTFKELYSKLRTDLPEAKVYVISVKPSEKLREHLESIQTLNQRIKQFASQEAGRLEFIDLYHLMMNKKGAPNPELFMPDKLHLTSKGYDVWETAIRKSSSLLESTTGQKKSALYIPPFVKKPERTPKYPLKTKRMIHQAEDLATARSNIKRYPKAKKVADGIIKAADQWLSWKDEDLVKILADARVPRAFDLNAKGCPKHGAEVFEKGGTYPWIIDAKHPFQVKCPVEGEMYPSNDYAAYYHSNFQDKKGWDTQYVDDGWGWVAPDGERYWFVAHANHWLWYKTISPAISHLSEAYLLTGDKRYAHKAAVMLYRLAEVYPSMDHENQSRYGLMSKAANNVYPGKVVNYIWETGFIESAAKAYDGIWDNIDEDQELQKLVKKNGEDIRSFIEANLLEEGLDSYFNGKVRGNFGMHQQALLYILLARQNMDTEKYINLLVDEPGTIRALTGLRYALYNQIFRDGMALESPGYNMIWVDRFAGLSELLKKGGIDLFEDPRVKKLLDGPIEVVAGGKHTVDWGDTGSVLGGIVGRNSDTYQIAYGAYNDSKYIDWLGSVNLTGDNTFLSFESLFRKRLPENKPLNNNRAVAVQPSRLFAGYGLGILNNKKDETSIALTYGMHFSHYHWDFLNFELFANGQKMMPDLGYPDAMNAYVPEIYSWSKNTIAHNTVVVDEQRQKQNPIGVIHDFSDGEFARSMDASSSAYSQTSLYRRNVIMVDVDDDQSYVVDFFRVTGGKRHDYSLHGPPGAVSTLNGKWSSIKKGTYAGEDVKLGYIYDDPKLSAEDYSGGYASYAGSGFQHLFNVQELESGQGLLEYKHVSDTNARLRLHLLSPDSQNVFMADAYDKPRAKNHILKYLVAQRTAMKGDGHLKSNFVSVLEPYTDATYVRSSKLLDLAEGEGIVVEVTREGAKDIVISDISNSSKTLKDYSLQTDANSAVITLDAQGKLKRVYFSNGTFLVYQGRRFESESIRGVVTNVDPRNQKIEVKINGKNQSYSGDISNRIAHFSNEYRTTAHPMQNLERNGGSVTITTKDDHLVGLLRLEDVNATVLTTTTHLPFAGLYNGVSVLDKNYSPVGKLINVQRGKLTLKEKIALPLNPGDDVWLSNIGIGDSMEIKSVFSKTF